MSTEALDRAPAETPAVVAFRRLTEAVDRGDLRRPIEAQRSLRRPGSTGFASATRHRPPDRGRSDDLFDVRAVGGFHELSEARHGRRVGRLAGQRRMVHSLLLSLLEMKRRAGLVHLLTSRRRAAPGPGLVTGSASSLRGSGCRSGARSGARTGDQAMPTFAAPAFRPGGGPSQFRSAATSSRHLITWPSSSPAVSTSRGRPARPVQHKGSFIGR